MSAEEGACPCKSGDKRRAAVGADVVGAVVTEGEVAPAGVRGARWRCLGGAGRGGLVREGCREREAAMLGLSEICRDWRLLVGG